MIPRNKHLKKPKNYDLDKLYRKYSLIEFNFENLLFAHKMGKSVSLTHYNIKGNMYYGIIVINNASFKQLDTIYDLVTLEIEFQERQKKMGQEIPRMMLHAKSKGLQDPNAPKYWSKFLRDLSKNYRILKLDYSYFEFHFHSTEMVVKDAQIYQFGRPKDLGYYLVMGIIILKSNLRREINPFYGMQNLSEIPQILGTNGQKPETNGQKPETNGQKPETNGQKPETNGQRLKSLEDPKMGKSET